MKLKRPFEKIVCLLTGLAFVLVLSQTTGNSLAYFTTYATAQGGHSVEYQNVRTNLQEEFKDWVKSIRVLNTGDSPCFVRVKALAGSQFTLTFIDASGKWSDGGDGYYYYSDILPAGESTEVLQIKVERPDWVTDSFNVLVVQESVPVSYQNGGTPYGDWSRR